MSGRSLRVSAQSFFQARPDGAEALVTVVADLIDAWLAPDVRLADLYCGVGLFGAVLGDRVGSVVGVEWSTTAVADAEHNLAPLKGRVVRAPVGEWRAERADVVIADPSRDGLGRDGVATISATDCAAVALVSCDAGALGRDAKLLLDAGFRFERAVVVDMFPHTHHVEVVSRFVR